MSLRMLAPGASNGSDHAALARGHIAADRHALVHERGTGDGPATALSAEPVGIRDARVREEHLVELGIAGELAQRSDLDPGGGHVADEEAEALMLGQVRVGACEQDAPPGDVRNRRPDLLSVDDPFVAVAHGPGCKAGEIGPGARLAEQLAPDVLAGPQGGEEARSLLGGAECEDGRRGHGR